MQQQFELFQKRISLKPNQKKDAKIKYKGVCKALHTAFYENDYTGETKFLFGSYKEKTAIRPITSSQDVDVIFKIPEEVFKQYASQERGPSRLLERIRKILLDSRYSLGEKPKAWGKVILITMKDGKHNIELLPGYEQGNGTFIIPNTDNGGSWEIFDPRKELKIFSHSNNKSDGLTRKLTRMIKSWKRNCSCVSLKSYQIKNFVILFLSEYEFKNRSYSSVVKDFFEFLNKNIDDKNKSYVETALTRCIKALNYEAEEKFEEATDEWIKIFGTCFPAMSAIGKSTIDDSVSPKEQFIENIFPVEINPQYALELDCEVEQNGWRKTLLSRISYLKKEKSLDFFIKNHNIPHPFSVKWKVRNYGEEAFKLNQLRGEILPDDGRFRKKETTRYRGEHLVECYAIKDGKCVACGKIKVPIDLMRS